MTKVKCQYDGDSKVMTLIKDVKETIEYIEAATASIRTTLDKCEADKRENAIRAIYVLVSTMAISTSLFTNLLTEGKWDEIQRLIDELANSGGGECAMSLLTFADEKIDENKKDDFLRGK